MKKTERNAIIYIVGTVVTAVTGLANTMILTRFLDTKTYAMYGLLSICVTAIVTIISLGYDASYTRFFYENQYSKVAFLFKCLKYPLILFVVFSVLLFEPKHVLIKLIFESDFAIYEISTIAIYVLFALINKFSQLTARMDERALNYIISNIIAKSGFIIIVVLSYYILHEVSFNTVVLSFAISSIISVIINLIKINNGEIDDNNYKFVNNNMLIKYGFPYVLHNSLVLLIPIIERIVIRNIGGWDVLSIYTAAAIFSTVIAMISNMIENIWQPIVYKNYYNEDGFKPLLHTTGLTVTCLMTVGLSFCIVLRRWLVLILDKEYFEVYIIAPVILYSACLNLLAGIYGVGINIKKKTMHLIIASIIQASVSIIMCYLLIPLLGLKGIGLSIITSIFFSRTYRIIIGLKLYGTGQNEKKFYILVFSCIIVSIAAMFFTNIFSDIIMFFILSVFMRFVVNNEFFEIIKNIKIILNK